MRIGYALPLLRTTPEQVLEQAVLAERLGFDSLWVGSLEQPARDLPGQRISVWSLVGAVAEHCTLPVRAVVGCAAVRQDPVQVAQAAASAAVMVERGFRLCVAPDGRPSGEGQGEGQRDRADRADRIAMLGEAVEVVTRLWRGEVVDHDGRFLTLRDARVYSMGHRPPELFLPGDWPDLPSTIEELADGLLTDEDGLPALAPVPGRSLDRKPVAASLGAVAAGLAPGTDAGTETTARLLSFATAGLDEVYLPAGSLGADATAITRAADTVLPLLRRHLGGGRALALTAAP